MKALPAKSKCKGCKGYFLQNLWNALYSSLKLTENLTLIGDFNLTPDKAGLQNVAGCYDLQDLKMLINLHFKFITKFQ